MNSILESLRSARKLRWFRDLSYRIVLVRWPTPCTGRCSLQMPCARVLFVASTLQDARRHCHFFLHAAVASSNCFVTLMLAKYLRFPYAIDLQLPNTHMCAIYDIIDVRQDVRRVHVHGLLGSSCSQSQPVTGSSLSPDHQVKSGRTSRPEGE